MLKYKEFVNTLIENRVNLYHESILLEGGAYGHLQHPFEDMDLTFSDLIELITLTVEGGFTQDNFISEKTDGQNIMISWRDNKLIAARNKSHLKNYGQNALDTQSIQELFAGRGDIETAYVLAMEDLTASIKGLSESDKIKYFNNGQKFASVEVITPITQNTVPYGQNLLVFHGVISYNEDGSPIGEDKAAGREIGKLLKDANLGVQKNFFVRGPADFNITPIPNADARKSYYIKQIKELMRSTGTKEDSTIKEFIMGSAKNIIRERLGESIPDVSLDGLARRISGIDKSYSIAKVKSDLGELGNRFLEMEKKEEKDLKRLVFRPLENIFIEIGTELMKHFGTLLVANPTEAAIKMRKEIESVIKSVKQEGSPEQVKKLEHELYRLSVAGGLESIIPSEGITFLYKGKLYKYTGIFMVLHQIRSILAYKK